MFIKLKQFPGGWQEFEKTHQIPKYCIKEAKPHIFNLKTTDYNQLMTKSGIKEFKLQLYYVFSEEILREGRRSTSSERKENYYV